MNAKHTPGPWKRDGVDIYANAPANVRPHIAHVIYGATADARLIAAAPELLEALRGLFEHCAMVHNQWGDNSNQKEADNAIKAARAAISKAEGRA